MAGLHTNCVLIQEILRNAGLPGRVRILDEPAPTAVAAARQLGVPVGAIANSLIFATAEQQPLLVLTSGAHRVDTGKVAALVGAQRVRRATAGGGNHHTMIGLTYPALLELTGGEPAAVA